MSSGVGAPKAGVFGGGAHQVVTRLRGNLIHITHAVPVCVVGVLVGFCENMHCKTGISKFVCCFFSPHEGHAGPRMISISLAFHELL